MLPMSTDPIRPVVLFVGGTDSSHKAGLDADQDAADAQGCDAITIASAVTDQDLFEVRSVEERLMWDHKATAAMEEAASGARPVAALKFGLLPGVASIVEAARLVARVSHGPRPIPAVVDPVIRSSSGYRFWRDREMVAVRDSLMVAGPILTPNLDELAELAWLDRNQIDESEETRIRAAEALIFGGASAVVAKGGHGPADAAVRDLVLEPGRDPVWIERPREPGKGIRGSGCRFAATLACALAAGRSLTEAAEIAGAFVARRIREQGAV
ncbi:Hydroxymethylpyrimidine/phosphomethylpyrimidine kinase [Planctomycetes bacterium Poly30]|uniref:Hydroxymethylpyrimidine/phosphomethylpyrimidine kinase n=2 Tax=Saltatorellus ferox TaxID=2528018 RepID=A0A518ENM4_9BACT|nr:Hydroxymethylpyrimidine/phosphomethylpyrimidine kinase [Planctomycetes bacterium Poly30]